MPTRYSWFLISFGTPTRMGCSSSAQLHEDGAHALHHAGDFVFGNNEGRCERQSVGADTPDHALGMEGTRKDLEPAPARRVRVWLDVDPGRHAAVPDIGHERSIFQRVNRLFQHALHLQRTREQLLVAIKIKRCKTRRACQRMARIGVAMKEFYRA